MPGAAGASRRLLSRPYGTLSPLQARRTQRAPAMLAPVFASAGAVESYPEDVKDRRVSGSFLHNGTVATFELEGFRRSRRLSKNHWVVTKIVHKSLRKGSHA